MEDKTILFEDRFPLDDEEWICEVKEGDFTMSCTGGDGVKERINESSSASVSSFVSASSLDLIASPFLSPPDYASCTSAVSS